MINSCCEIAALFHMTASPFLVVFDESLAVFHLSQVNCSADIMILPYKRSFFKKKKKLQRARKTSKDSIGLCW